LEHNRKRVAKRLASGLMAGALALGGLAISGSSPAGAIPVELDSDQRLGGADRYSTSSLVAEEIDDLVTGGASTVIVANGEDFPDALSAAPLTEAGDAPVLLVQADSIPRSVADRMNRLTSSVDDVIVVGGTAAISAEVYAEIEDIFDDADVVRVAGDNRYATAAAVADEVGYGDAVAIVSGQNWADAVTIGGWASDNAIPILLANADGVPTETSEALTTALDEGVTRAIIVGGSAAVGSSVEGDLVDLGFAPADISRIAGSDRYQTNLLFNLEQFGDTPAKHIADLNDELDGIHMMMVSGRNFPDALSAAPLAANIGAHLVLVDPVSGGSSLTTLAYAATVSTTLDVLTPLGAMNAVLAGLTDGEGLLALLQGALGYNVNGDYVAEDIWVVGGETAVPDSVVDIFATVAGGGDLGCSVLVGGSSSATAGPDSFVIAFGGNLQKSAVGANTDEVDVLTTAATLSDYIEIDGDPVAAADITPAGLDLNEDGFVDAVAVVLGAAIDNMVEDTEIDFLGIEADTTDYADGVGTFMRDLSACSGTVAEDDEAPTMSIDALQGSTYAYVEFSETMLADYSTAVATALDDDNAAGSAFACVVLDSGNSQYFCEDAGNNDPWAAAEVIDTPATTFYDEAGNAAAAVAAADGFDVIDTADYEPGVADASVTCSKVGDGEAKAAKWNGTTDYAAVADDTDLVYSAAVIEIPAGAGVISLTAGTGIANTDGNTWSVVIEHERGLLMPEVTVDGTTMTVTVDRFAHTAADIVRAIDASAWGEGGLSSMWDAATTSATGLVASTDIGDSFTSDDGTTGTLTCNFTITMDTALVGLLAAYDLDNVTAQPGSDGQFRIMVAGTAIDVDSLDGAGTELEYQFEDAQEGGRVIEGVFEINELGSVRVETYEGGLSRLNV